MIDPAQNWHEKEFWRCASVSESFVANQNNSTTFF